MKRILGLDLGVASIGWAIIEEAETNRIIGMGCRVVPLSTDDKNEFTTGNAISKNQKRTQKRTQRKGYDRYQLRRKNLIDELKKAGLMPGEELIGLNKLELWGLRSRAVTEKILPGQLGRVLLHLNQKRGYKSARSEANLDKKETEYVANVMSRHLKIKEEGFTIGQKFYFELSNDQYFRIKENVFPREAYLEEFDAILLKQKEFYPSILTDDFIHRLRNEIIYYQRKLKSQKGKVSICEFEGINRKDKNGVEILTGPRVAPRSSPLFQVCKIWENINNLTLKDKEGYYIEIPDIKKRDIFQYLDNNENMTYAVLLKILGLKKEDVYANKQITKGIQGNLTKTAFIKHFGEKPEFLNLLSFNLIINEFPDEVFLTDKRTGEIINAKKRMIVSSSIENEPFYQLWHTAYSIPEKEECINALIKKFALPRDIAGAIASIDFTKAGFGNKSHKAMRKILPYLMEGDVYSDACTYAGYNHSNSLTRGENFKRELLEKLEPIKKNSLRQPVVEKILNQMINMVNAIIDKYGRPDEIRIELARELKQSLQERNDTYKAINRIEKENKEIALRLQEFGLRSTRKNIIKWRLYHEINNEDKKLNAVCIYCNKPISLSAALSGEEVDVEHIIPQSRLFDDSQSNKTLSHRKCNSAKGNLTAYDFMKTRSQAEFDDYIERVNLLFKNGLIGKGKRDRLLMPGTKIPDDFIERQLRQTQYISKKARDILTTVCRNVWATSGNVTAELRKVWGWDEILMNLQLTRYKEKGLTVSKEIENRDNRGQKETIPDWNKRDDHRHHAIDALTIACTKQSFIHRINNLNSSTVKDDMRRDIVDAGLEFDKRKDLLENYIFSQKPFTTAEVAAEADKILVSFKPGKKVATKGVRKVLANGKKKVVQKNIIIPRGALSEESVYGKILVHQKKMPVKYIFENPDLIIKPYIKQLVEERLYKHDNHPKEAVKSLKNEPIYLDNEKSIPLTHATCYAEEVVIKKPVASLSEKNIEDIVDEKIKSIMKARLAKAGGKAKEAFKDLENDPIWFNPEKKIPVLTVRCFTGLKAIEPLKENSSAGYVKPGNNHHIAFYFNEDGQKTAHICTFWHAVERKKFGLPVIIKEPASVLDPILDSPEGKYPESFLGKLPGYKWEFITSLQQNELFILGMEKEDLERALELNDTRIISRNLYRVQKISGEGDNIYLVFRHHLESKADEDTNIFNGFKFYRVQSINSLFNLNPYKISVNCIGCLVKNK